MSDKELESELIYSDMLSGFDKIASFKVGKTLGITPSGGYD